MLLMTDGGASDHAQAAEEFAKELPKLSKRFEKLEVVIVGVGKQHDDQKMKSIFGSLESQFQGSLGHLSYINIPECNSPAGKIQLPNLMSEAELGHLAKNIIDFCSMRELTLGIVNNTREAFAALTRVLIKCGDNLRIVAVELDASGLYSLRLTKEEATALDNDELVVFVERGQMHRLQINKQAAAPTADAFQLSVLKRKLRTLNVELSSTAIPQDRVLELKVEFEEFELSHESQLQRLAESNHPQAKEATKLKQTMEQTRGYLRLRLAGNISEEPRREFLEVAHNRDWRR